MSKTKAVVFSKEELKTLIEDKNSCVTVHKSFYNLALYPYHLTDIVSSIKDILNAGVAKYDKKLDGILLGYKNVKILTPQGAIVTDSCYIHVDIEADFYIFKPEVGATLTGIVNKKSKDHVGCLVHRIFNVSVPNKNEDNAWPGYHVEIGEEVLLQVTYINLDARLPYIRTSFIVTNSKKKKKKSKTIDEVDASFLNNELQEFKLNKKDLNTTVTPAQSPKTKKKKKKSREESNNKEINDVAKITIESSTEIKVDKKKKRRSKDKNDSLPNLNITVEDERLNNAVNNTLNASTEIKSPKKSKRKSKDNNVSENVKIDNESKTIHNISNSTSDIKSEKKNKRKSKDNNVTSEKLNSSTIEETINNVANGIFISTIKPESGKKKRKSKDNTSTNELGVSKTTSTKVNGIDTNLQALRNSLLAEQLATLGQLETPKNSKKRKRKSDDSVINSETPVINSAEVRKSKKRKTSFSENLSEANLELRNSYADTTMDDSFKTPKKSKKNKRENSLDKPEFSETVIDSIIIAKSNKKRKHSLSESDGPIMNKKKRKHSETDVHNESVNEVNNSPVKKKHKSKKNKHHDVDIGNC